MISSTIAYARKVPITTFVTTSQATSSPAYQGYEEAVKNLKNHLEDLANPCLVEDILQKLDQTSTSKISILDGIYSFFSTLTLPEETKSLLHTLNKKIFFFGSNHPSELATLSTQIKKDFQQLASTRRTPDFPLWDELKRLLNLPQIKALENGRVKKMLHLIKERKTEELKEYVIHESQLDENDLNATLKSGGYSFKIKTLLSQVINRKPQTSDGICDYWDREESFFENKTLHLMDPNSHTSLTGVITKCSRRLADQTLHLTLHDKSELEIPVNFTPTLIEKCQYKFWHALSHNVLDKEEIFILESQEDTVENGITPGTYSISFPGQVKISQNRLEQMGKYLKETLLSQNQAYIELKPLSKTTAFLLQYDPHLPSPSIHIYRGVESNQAKDKADYQFHFISTYSSQDLNRLYSIAKITRKIIHGIHKDNANQNIQIKDEQDDNKIKLIKLQNLREEINSLRVELLKEEKKPFLNALLDNLVIHQLTHINMRMLSQDNDFKLRLETISDKYKKDVNIEYSPPDILKTLVLDANYAILVNKEQSTIVSRTMSLLQEAYQHIHKMDGKEIILVMGNTGAGKSTAVGYFLGLEMESFYNRVGDKVIRIKDDPTKQSDKSHPKIGQSLGESETLYTQGYPLPGDSNILLGDCPGFHDTRGGDYEICTNLSIDEAVAKVKKIRAIVMILPIYAFLDEKANRVIDSIEIVKERFPNLFQAPQKNVCILITKCGQMPVEAANGLKNGARILELLSEANARIKVLSEKIQSGADNRESEYELIGLQKRRNIWHTLKTMYQDKKIHFIDIDNEEEREEILKRYTQSENYIDKAEYVRAMQGGEMQRKFGKYVEMAAHTWTHSIIEPYFTIFPQRIQTSSNEIKAKIQKINSLKEGWDITEQELKNLEKKIEQSQQMISQLENASQNEDLLSEELLNDLKKRTMDSEGQELARLSAEIQRLESKISENKMELEEIKSQIDRMKEDKSKKESKKQELEDEIEELKKGSKKISLWKFKPKPEEKIVVTTIKNIAARIALFDEMRSEYNQADIVEETSYIAKDYRGPLWHTAKIEKDFQLIPVGEEAREEFRSLGSSKKGIIGNTHVAYVKGKRFKIDDLGRKADPTGRAVIYSFSTLWEGKKIPWIEIAHKIPNIDINAAAIVNKQNEIDCLRDEINRLALDLDGNMTHNPPGAILGKLSEKVNIEMKGVHSTVLLNEKRQELENLKTKAKKEHLSAMLQSEKETKERREKEIIARKLELNQINDEIKRIEKEIEAEKSNLDALKKSRRNLAIIIHEQHEMAKQLRDFAALVVGHDQKLPLQGTSATISTCQDYIKIYDQNFKKVKEECQKELGLKS